MSGSRLINPFEKHEKEPILTGLIDSIAGFLAGAVQTYVVQPFDTVKVKLQIFPTLYPTAWKCFKETYRFDGFFRGFYIGTLPALTSSVLENSVLFSAYGSAQHVVVNILRTPHTDDLPVVADAIAGGISGGIISLFVCPTELIKCKLQACRERIRLDEKQINKAPWSAWKLTKHIYIRNGIRGLYRGLCVTNLRDIPGYFACFGGYEGTRVLLTKPNQTKHDIGPVDTMIAGSVGGILLYVISNPMDVIKSRIQVLNLDQGSLTIGRNIWKEEGFLRLYQGLSLNIFRTIPGNAVLFIVVEYTTKFLHTQIN